jgi:hypothetical protein
MICKASSSILDGDKFGEQGVPALWVSPFLTSPGQMRGQEQTRARLGIFQIDGAVN